MGCRLWDAMEKYEANIDNDIITHKNAWIGEKVKQIEKRRDLKMYLHKERYDRIISVVYNTRLLEVRAHWTRFQSHKVVSFSAKFFIRSPIRQLYSLFNQIKTRFRVLGST